MGIILVNVTFSNKMLSAAGCRMSTQTGYKLKKIFSHNKHAIYTRATIRTLNKFGKIIVNLIRNQINQRDSPTRFSTSCFFHHLNQPEPLTNGLKYFRFWFRFRRDI